MDTINAILEFLKGGGGISLAAAALGALLAHLFHRFRRFEALSGRRWDKVADFCEKVLDAAVEAKFAADRFAEEMAPHPNVENLRASGAYGALERFHKEIFKERGLALALVSKQLNRSIEQYSRSLGAISPTLFPFLYLLEPDPAAKEDHQNSAKSHFKERLERIEKQFDALVLAVRRELSTSRLHRESTRYWLQRKDPAT